MERAREIFDRVDVSSDGVIDRSEMGALLEALGVEPTNQNVVSAIVDMDVGHVGTVSFEDFYTYYKTNFLPRQPLKAVASKHVAGIGEAKQATYTLPPKTFCFGKALQRDKENAGQVLRQLGDAGDDNVGRQKKLPMPGRPSTATSKASETRSTLPAKPPKPDVEAAIDPGLAFILSQLKAQLKSMGANGLLGLSRRFRIMDDDNSRSLSCAELRKALKEACVDISDKDCRLLFELFDTDRSGSVDFDEFLRALSDPMSAARVAVVRQAFDALDRDGNGVLDASDIKGRYDASKHPDVRSGLKTEHEVLTDFLTGFFLAPAAARGPVTWAAFTQYYQHLSNSVDDDALFCAMVANAWRVRPPMAAAWSSERPKTAKSAASTAKSAISTARPKTQTHFPRATHAWLSADSAGALLYNAATPAPPSAEAPAIDMATLDAGTKGVIARVRSQMKSVGVPAFATVHRRAKLTPTMTLAQFKDTMKEAGVVLSDKDWRHLFELYDPRDSGAIAFSVLLSQLLSDRMPDTRRALVRRTFRALDNAKAGSIGYGELMERFDPRGHPDVRSGKSSEAQVHANFQDAFVVPASGGLVDLEAFEAYYDMVSNALEDDRHFEAVVRDVWHTTFDTANDDAKSVASSGRRSAVEAPEAKTKRDPLQLYQESVQAQKATNAKARRGSRATRSSISRASTASKAKSQKKSWI
ncbi:hypothetical protein ACHHYP_01662 [Achlya hypogyna]|uniref:EF-hand domain-containing protein n=1 Tax=Achlya hypogyna TaxID=1202772 RepID=A0A1V9Z881_ACHHY|nr:hypothetical protein ACHHYP_01662 [Achlya hypogyna]